MVIQNQEGWEGHRNRSIPQEMWLPQVPTAPNSNSKTDKKRTLTVVPFKERREVDALSSQRHRDRTSVKLVV